MKNYAITRSDDSVDHIRAESVDAARDSHARTLGYDGAASARRDGYPIDAVKIEEAPNYVRPTPPDMFGLLGMANQPEYTDCENCGSVDHRGYACPCGCHGTRAAS